MNFNKLQSLAIRYPFTNPELQGIDTLATGWPDMVILRDGLAAIMDNNHRLARNVKTELQRKRNFYPEHSEINPYRSPKSYNIAKIIFQLCDIVGWHDITKLECESESNRRCIIKELSIIQEKIDWMYWMMN